MPPEAIQFCPDTPAQHALYKALARGTLADVDAALAAGAQREGTYKHVKLTAMGQPSTYDLPLCAAACRRPWPFIVGLVARGFLGSAVWLERAIKANDGATYEHLLQADVTLAIQHTERDGLCRAVPRTQAMTWLQAMHRARQAHGLGRWEPSCTLVLWEHAYPVDIYDWVRAHTQGWDDHCDHIALARAFQAGRHGLVKATLARPTFATSTGWRAGVLALGVRALDHIDGPAGARLLLRAMAAGAFAQPGLPEAIIANLHSQRATQQLPWLRALDRIGQLPSTLAQARYAAAIQEWATHQVAQGGAVLWLQAHGATPWAEAAPFATLTAGFIKRSQIGHCSALINPLDGLALWEACRTHPSAPADALAQERAAFATLSQANLDLGELGARVAAHLRQAELVARPVHAPPRPRHRA